MPDPQIASRKEKTWKQVMEKEHKKEAASHVSEFVKKNWPAAVFFTGTVVGAAIWITSRYLRHKKERANEVERNLKQIESEAETSLYPVETMLELGGHLAKTMGDEAAVAAEELKDHVTDEEGKKALDLLKEVAKMEAKNK